MPALQDPVNGFYYGWTTGESGMKLQLDSNWLKMGALLNCAVISRALNAPPASPVAGARYIPKSPTSGGWTDGAVTYSNRIVVYRNGGWDVYEPTDGMNCNIMDEGTYGTRSVYKKATNTWSPGSANS